mmetsp:Transcript_44854/g.74733  ORF Transcript_44854/g.74733 Transcript_44854/m.74733 type:complete len:268 (-) Transcript_44854:179-982(-)
MARRAPTDTRPSWNNMHKAVVCERYDIVERMLKKGANVNETTLRGVTALHLACADGLNNFVTLLIEHGADVNAQNVDGETPLHFAVRNGSEETIRLLLDADADIDATDDELHTPLHWAIVEDNSVLVALLLEHGADPFAETIMEGNAAMVAVLNNCYDSLQILLSHCPSIASRLDEDGNSLLHLAACSGHEDIVHLLLNTGLPTDILNDDDATAADVATSAHIATIITSSPCPSSSSSPTTTPSSSPTTSQSSLSDSSDKSPLPIFL